MIQLDGDTPPEASYETVAASNIQDDTISWQDAEKRFSDETAHTLKNNSNPEYETIKEMYSRILTGLAKNKQFKRHQHGNVFRGFIELIDGKKLNIQIRPKNISKKKVFSISILDFDTKEGVKDINILNEILTNASDYIVKEDFNGVDGTKLGELHSLYNDNNKGNI